MDNVHLGDEINSPFYQINAVKNRINSFLN